MNMVSMAARRLPLLLFAAVLLLHPLAPCHASTEDVDAAAARRECTYTVRVKTSCASPARTADTVSVAFGDAYRNEAYGARLPAGASGALERCAVDTFRVGGQCGYGVCYLYLRRAGRDGWAPEWVQVFEPGAAAGEKPSTFYFGSPLPDGVWYGHNRCPKASPAMVARRTNTSASPLG